MNQEIEVRPGIVSKDSEGKLQCRAIFSRIVSLFAEQNDLQFAVPGGLIGRNSSRLWLLTPHFVAMYLVYHLRPGLNTTMIFTIFHSATKFTKKWIFRNFCNFRKIHSSR